MLGRQCVLVIVACVALSAGSAVAVSNAGPLKSGDLVVFVADSATSKPLRGVNVTVRGPYSKGSRLETPLKVDLARDGRKEVSPCMTNPAKRPLFISRVNFFVA